MLGRNEHEQGILKLEDAAVGSSQTCGRSGVKAVAYQSMPTEAVRDLDCA